MTAVKKDIDYILDELVGGNGWWQWKISFLSLPVWWASLYPLLLSIFAAYTPKFRCRIPSCDTDSSQVIEPFLNFTIPKPKNSDDVFGGKKGTCEMFAAVSANSEHGSCLPEHFDQEKAVACDSFVYEKSQMTETLATILNLVCEEDSKNYLFGVSIMAGLLIGSIIGGHVGDKFGRKMSMFGSVLVIVPSVIAGGYTTDLYGYIALRLITCIALTIIWVTGTAYHLEIFSPNSRKVISCVKDFPIFQFILVAALYFNRDWTSLHLCVGLLCATALPLWFFLPESPRWLAGNGKFEEAEKILLEIAKTNKRTLTKAQKQEIRNILENVTMETESSLSPLHMFQKGYILKTLILIMCWVTVCVGYYALSLNTTKLDGDIVLNYLYTSLADLPVCFIMYFSLDNLGRRFCMAMSQGLLGVSCIAMAFIPKDEEHSDYLLMAYLLGKLASGMGFIMVYLVTAEVFPTNLRTQALGTCSMIARVFGFIAPYITGLKAYWVSLPMLVLGIPTLISAFLSVFLTETSGEDLPQTMEEGKTMGKTKPRNDVGHSNKAFT